MRSSDYATTRNDKLAGYQAFQHGDDPWAAGKHAVAIERRRLIDGYARACEKQRRPTLKVSRWEFAI